MDSFETVLQEATGYYEEKRSRFIASLFHVTSEQEANEAIARVRRENREARHVVSAFLLHTDGLSRFSDDGEPHGTAGKPVFDCLSGSGLTDVCLCVTRYFGGILLGTGGLCRAYTAAAQACLSAANRVRYRPCDTFRMTCSYAEYPILKEWIERFGGELGTADFGENVTVSFAVPCEQSLSLGAQIREQFAGKELLQKEKTVFLPVSL